MKGNETLITIEGLEELKRELEELKIVKRKEISEKIKAALAFGDISENAEYDEAKNEQAIVEARIAKLETMIKNAKVIKTTKKNGVVCIGSKVRIKDLEFDEEMEYTIVGSAEADPFKGRISNVSPLGKALLGKKLGDIIEVASPAGDMIKYEILTV
ncbi:MAG TPA: transcription elongation factor GreA [Sedimentibacter sp.]|jgi:transcription elongation factor GreA|nr:transcription elongation factor GreA [Sedimentibacter sp.]NLA13062.1 transcription elongation factor GreA [Tissierellia bacterium]HOA20829.1 transcription elongation factor GreA [Sedimentibacter sp.]HOG63766.1 transcription elongation factor GreA [Sedimentibacter sp.]HPB79867.1 transcription elongation factor GreA [Sedimentibacter sp.]